MSVSVRAGVCGGVADIIYLFILFLHVTTTCYMYVHVHESCNRRRCVHRRWRMHQCQCVHRCWRIHRRQRRVVHRCRRQCNHHYVAWRAWCVWGGRWRRCNNHNVAVCVCVCGGGLLTSFIITTTILHTYHTCHYLVSRLRGGLLTSFIAQTSTLHTTHDIHLLLLPSIYCATILHSTLLLHRCVCVGGGC